MFSSQNSVSLSFWNILTLLSTIPLLVAAFASPGNQGKLSLRDTSARQHAHALVRRGEGRRQSHPHLGAKRGQRSFITQDGGKLRLDGKVFRFASYNAPELMEGNDDFEVEDTMKTFAAFDSRVLRTYTLNIEGSSPHLPAGRGHLTGWDSVKNDWIYNESMFRKLDSVLALAAKYDVRLIIPIINEETGSVATNWVGNWVDLVIYRYPAQGWDYDAAKANVNFYTNRTMIDSFKQIITFMLNRRNTVNGVRYGDDPSIMAWETGNELSYRLPNGDSSAPPGAWTVEIAAHIKSLAPRTLVVDGSFARNQPISNSYAMEALQSKDVNIFSYHYYSGLDFLRIATEATYLRQFGKAFIVGEYGLVTPHHLYSLFLTASIPSGVCGTLIWSFRPHSVEGGFKVHREDATSAAYHFPGWPNPSTPATWKPSVNWDPAEHPIMETIYRTSFALNGKLFGITYPVPSAPEVWLISGTRNISWRGAAWANNYEVWVLNTAKKGGRGDGQWTRLAEGLLDAVPGGSLSWTLPQDASGSLRIRGMSLAGKAGAWSNIIKI